MPWGAVSPMATMNGQPTPAPPGIVNNDLKALLIKRLDSMDCKLAMLDSIQTTVNSLNCRLQTMEQTINDLQIKVRDLEKSREFDTQTMSDINNTHKYVENFMKTHKQNGQEHSDIVNELKNEIQDLKCRSMRDNLLFHNLPEEKEENCEQKVLKFIKEKLNIEEREVRLQRAHRIGPFNPSKTRPIVAKFSDYPVRENVRRAARKLKGTNFGISEQYPKEVVEKRRQLVPIMLQARKDGKEAYLNVDKLYINKQLYRGPC